VRRELSSDYQARSGLYQKSEETFCEVNAPLFVSAVLFESSLRDGQSRDATIEFVTAFLDVWGSSSVFGAKTLTVSVIGQLATPKAIDEEIYGLGTRLRVREKTFCIYQ